jgi:cytochrome c
MVILLITSCQQPGQNSTGSEYMPDMAHSIAYESNYYNYYYNNTWGSKDEYYKFVQPRKPVNGTVPRGYAGNALSGETKNSANATSIAVPMNGSVPYYFEDTEEGRTKATEELINNPYPITEMGLNKGKELYNTFCAICHGEKGDGAGYLVRDDGGVYPVQPAILINDEFTAASNGRLFHAIIYGKNLMGGYADKVGYEERWQIVHYIRSLQAKEKKLEYTQFINTLNSIDKPAGDITVEEISMVDEAEGDHSSDTHSEDSHTESH